MEERADEADGGQAALRVVAVGLEVGLHERFEEGMVLGGEGALRAEEFAEEEGVALRALPQRGDQAVDVGRPQAIARADEGTAVLRGQRAQVEACGSRLAHERGEEGVERVPAGQLVGAVGREQ